MSDDQRGRGRPHIGRPVCIRLEPDTLDAVDHAAAQHDPPITRAAMVRILIAVALTDT